MAKKITGYIKLQVPAGDAKPAPPIGPALGQRGVNIMEFCKAFNAQTAGVEKGTPLPTIITVYADRSFTFTMKQPPATFLIKKAMNLKSGSKEPGKIVAGKITRAQLAEIAQAKMVDLNANDNEDHRRLRSRDGPRRGGGLIIMAKLTKKAKALATAVDREKLHGVDEALGLIKTHATAKFDESVEIAINLGVDPRHADQMVRGVVTLPAGTGKDVRVAVFARNEKAQAALDAGADIVGAEDLLESIQAGNIDFQRVIATPDMMGLVGRLGKILGPKGLMPNPKLGTVTPNVAEAVKAAKGGQIEFRVEKAGIIHAGLGKSSFTAEDLRKNFDAFVDAIVKAKPTGSKGKYVRKIALSSSMGPGVKVDVAEVAAV